MAEKPVVEFGPMPAYMGCVDSESQDDIVAPMVWGINSAGLLAVMDPPPLHAVYPAQHNDPTVSPLWMKHHRAFALFTADHTTSSLILEVGGADGTLADIVLTEMGLKIDWRIIEPNPHVKEESAARVYEGWFPQDLPPGQAFWPCIVSSHVLEHALDPYQYLSDCSNALRLNGDLILTWPDMGAMAERTDLNMLNFEHLHFLPQETVEEMLRITGFEVLSVEKFQGHSIFIHAKKREAPAARPEKFNTDQELLTAMAERYWASLKSTVDRFRAEINAWDGEVWLFGAHVFSQYLLAMGLEPIRLSGILDNAPGKQGKRLYGTASEVSSPEALRGTSGNLILIAAALYEDEIMEQLQHLEMHESKIVLSRAESVDLV